MFGVLRIYVPLATGIFQPYCCLEAGEYHAISEIVGSRSGIEPWPLALQAKSLTTTPPLLHMTMKDGQKTFASFYPCQCSKKKSRVFLKHYGMSLAATKSKKLFLASRSKSRSQGH